MPPTAQFQEQYTALTRGIGAARLDRTLIELRGGDRASFMHAFCTGDVKKLAPGEGCEAFVPGAQGKTLGHVLVLRETDRLLLDTSAGQAQPLIAHFDKYVISEDVEFRDLSAESRDVLVAGPQAEKLLRDVLQADPPAVRLAHVQGAIAGQDATVARVDYAGPDSFFVRTAASSEQAVLNALVSAGAATCDSDAVEAARLEAGFPLFGRDITPDNLPQEVGRDALAISFTKGCYLGQETIARIDALGHVNKLLVGLKFAGTDLPQPGTQLRSGDKPVGEVTSSAWSPRLGGPLALGYVRRLLTKRGTVLETVGAAAEVVALPLAADA